MYNTFDNIKKGTNLAIYCILSQIENWQLRHQGLFPEVIFLQIDGGSENANVCLLSMCELLVHKRIASEIWVIRLPTGHTHEDIDASFGHIWKWMRNRPIETLKEYEDGIKESFDKCALKVYVRFVYSLPAYKTFLKDHIDDCFGLFAKEEHSKHCVHIQAVEFSEAFPLGVKTLYSAYTSRTVVEFQKLPPERCQSTIGRLIGLEPYTVHNNWFPNETSIESRQGISGFYILSSIPNLVEENFPTVTFDEEEIKRVNECYKAVKSKWTDLESFERQWWDTWMRNVAPNRSAVQYLNMNRQHLPLNMYLINRQIRYRPNWLLQNRYHCPVLDANSTLTTPWPDQHIFSMHSVTSSWCRDPGPSRSNVLSQPKVQTKSNDFTQSEV
jgi:hypothetical protein